MQGAGEGDQAAEGEPSKSKLDVGHLPTQCVKKLDGLFFQSVFIPASHMGNSRKEMLSSLVQISNRIQVSRLQQSPKLASVEVSLFAATEFWTKDAAARLLGVSYPSTGQDRKYEKAMSFSFGVSSRGTLLNVAFRDATSWFPKSRKPLVCILCK